MIMNCISVNLLFNTFVRNIKDIIPLTGDGNFLQKKLNYRFTNRGDVKKSTPGKVKRLEQCTGESIYLEFRTWYW